MLFLVIFYSNKYASSWGAQNYAVLYYAGLFFLTLFGIGYSFIELRDKRSAQLYLILPGSAMEKYLIQFLTRIVLFPILFTLLFVLGVEVSKSIFQISSVTIYGKSPTLVVDDLDVFNMLSLFYLWKLPILYYMFIGIGGVIVSIMFTGGIVFGKWNVLLMPLSFLGFTLLLFLTSIVLSWIVIGIPEDSSELFISQIRFQQPEIFTDTPLIVFVVTVLMWLAIPQFFLVAYFKLKEYEV
ncbi:hypothetical protein [Algoriphagus ratkowskyi]|nr:hypothetical protein [Algoriphagus ratkowskyi]TXD79249.1 hypothetical protein ESW18_03155 [Algoriphagus ratkowskyi]